MNQIISAILFSTIGSVFGALIVFFSTYGIKITKKARENAKLKREEEIKKWKTLDLGIRQGITNKYLFDVLKYLLLGNLLLTVPVFFSIIDFIGIIEGFIVYRIINSLFGLIALIFFFIGVGKVIRYLMLRNLDSN